jgi:hypothetical protein
VKADVLGQDWQKLIAEVEMKGEGEELKNFLKNDSACIHF